MLLEWVDSAVALMLISMYEEDARYTTHLVS